MARTKIRERCSGCGAPVDLEASACGYCGAPSPHAVRASRARDAAALEREEADLRAKRDALGKRGNVALIWSIVGLVVCCLPIPGVVAVWLARRVQIDARAGGWVAPGAATAAMILGAVNILLFSTFSVVVAFEMRALSQRKALLHEQVAEAAGRAALEQSTACALAELRLLEDGFEEHSGTTTMMETFECAGRLDVDGDRAVLRELSFKKASEPRTMFEACLTHGARWHVVKLVRAEAGCD